MDYDKSKLVAMIRDMVYSSNLNMYELFKEGATGGALDAQGFTKIIDVISEGNVGSADIEQTFKLLPKNKNGKVSF